MDNLSLKTAMDTFMMSEPLMRGKALKTLQRQVKTQDNRIITKQQWVEELFEAHPNLTTEQAAIMNKGKDVMKWWIGDWEANKTEVDYYEHLKNIIYNKNNN